MQLRERSHICEKRGRPPLFLPSLSFSFCHSCWQSLIVLDKLMKSNTEERTGRARSSLHLPKCMSVCAYLPLTVSDCLVSPGVQSTWWWDSERVMRSSSIAAGRGPSCRHEMVMNINYSRIARSEKTEKYGQSGKNNTYTQTLRFQTPLSWAL